MVLCLVAHLAITSWQQYDKESLSGSGQQRMAGCTHWLIFCVDQLKGLPPSVELLLIFSERNYSDSERE